MKQNIIIKSDKLPKGWAKTPLDNIIIRISNGTTEQQSKNKTKFPVSRIETISKGTINFDKVRYLNPSSEILEKYKMKKGDILFSNINSDVHLGKTAIFFDNKVLLHGMNLLLIRSNSKILDPTFLNFQMNHFRDIGKFSSIAQHAINQSSINQTKLKNMDFFLPPLNEQIRIVTKIKKLFLEINSTKKLLMDTIPQLEQSRKSLLFSAFTGKLTEKWRKKNNVISSNELKENLEKKYDIQFETIVNSKEYGLIKIPKEWLWINVRSITELMKNGIYKPKNFYTDDGIACLRMYNIDNWKILWIKIKRMNLDSKDIDEYQLQTNDILVNRVNSKELVGKSAVIEDGLEKCVFESKNIRLRLKSFMNPWFVNFWFEIFSQRYYSNNFQQTVGMASINQDQLSQMPLPIMILEEQNEIISILKHNFSLIENTKNIINSMMEQLGLLRSSILKQAFEGKLVSQNPNDEPVSKILEKIQSQKNEVTKLK